MDMVLRFNCCLSCDLGVKLCAGWPVVGWKLEDVLEIDDRMWVQRIGCRAV